MQANIETTALPPSEALPTERKPRHARSLTWWLLLLVVWTLSGVYTVRLLKRGWVAYDEGTFGQCAERVLDGQLPHRDFDDPYTGGLSYLNAIAFSALGTNSAKPRIVLFLFFLGFVPAVYAIASRFASPLGAGTATLLAVVWSVPNYTAAVPSWYNLFFAVFGTAAVLRFIESGRRRWLFVAGLCGGVSFLFKISGIYFIASVLLLLIFREVCTPHQVPSGKPGSRIYNIFLKALSVVFIVGPFIIIRRNLSAVAMLEFMLPVVALVILCLWRDSRREAGPPGQRFVSLFRALLPFAAGVALPVSLFLVPYLRSGSLWAFFNGVFLMSIRRLDFAARRPAELRLIRVVATLTLAGLLTRAIAVRAPITWSKRVPLLVGLGFLFLASARFPLVYQFAWGPLTLLIPLAVLAGSILLAMARVTKGLSVVRQQQIMLLLSVAALCGLIQVPFSVANYFCYAAPLLVLALLALLSIREGASRFVLGALAVFYIAFAVFRSTPTFLAFMGNRYLRDQQIHQLTIVRAGGLRVYPSEGEEYDRLIPVVLEHAGSSRFVYCAPDCPEVAFLAGLRNPTRTLFDFLDQPAEHTQRALQAIGSHPVNVIAILSEPPFSNPMSADLHAALREQFPEYTQIGRFEVRWRR